MRNMRGEDRTDPGLSGGVGDPRSLTPPPGAPRMVSRTVPTQLLWRDRFGTGLGITTWREEDHVIAGSEGHELQTSEHHDGAATEWVKSVCHPNLPSRDG